MTRIPNLTDQSPLVCMPYLKTETCDVGVHLHDTYEIYQPISNNVQYFIEGKSYRLKAGDLMLTANNLIHRPTTIDDGPYIRRFIQFSPELIQTWPDVPYSPLDILRDRRSILIAAPSEEAAVIEDFFSDIHRLLEADTARGAYEGRMRLCDFLLYLTALSEEHHPHSHRKLAIDPRVKSVLAYLDAHFTKAFDLALISQALLMDKYYMCHLFKSHTGVTLLEYVQSKRIQLAKTLIAGDLTMNEISLMCGYEDYSNFYKAFRKLMGCSPMQYRRSLVGGV